MCDVTQKPIEKIEWNGCTIAENLLDYYAAIRRLTLKLVVDSFPHKLDITINKALPEELCVKYNVITFIN